MTLKQTLINYFFEYFNDYLTVEKFAEDKGISITDAKTIIRLGKKYHNELCKLHNELSKLVK